MIEKISVASIKKYINEERFNNAQDQNIYDYLVSEGIDREFIVQLLITMIHPKNINSARMYNYILMALIALELFVLVFIFGLSPAYLIGGLISIFFFRRFSISAYYWFLFFLIFMIGNYLINAIGISKLELLPVFVICGVFLGLPGIIVLKIIGILQPYRGGKGIYMSPNGRHIFQ